MRFPVLGAALLLAFTGCADSTPAAHPGFDARFGALEPELRIDGYAEDLVPIGAAAVSDRGTIALTQSQDGVVRFYSPSGELLGRFGSRGQGPGEFMALVRIGWSADTLWVYDGSLRRVTLISSSLELVRTVSNIPQAARPTEEDARDIPEFPFAYVQAVGPDGALYVGLGLSVNQIVPEPFRGRMTLGRIDAHGVIRQILLPLPRDEGGSVTTPDGGVATVPFGNSASFALSPGSARAAVAMASLEGPEAGTFSLTVVGLEGDTLLDRRYRFEPEPIPAAVGDSVMQASIERTSQFSSTLAEAARRGARVPAVYPPLTGLLIGGDGTVWIAQRERAEGRPYYVVTPGGEVLGTVVAPPGGRVAAAERGRIWVVEPDELGVQSVVRYAVRWE